MGWRVACSVLLVMNALHGLHPCLALLGSILTPAQCNKSILINNLVPAITVQLVHTALQL